MKQARSKELAFEDYLAFFHNPDPRDLSVEQLNKILSIHGLCKRKIKKQVMEDLSCLEMMSPKRSTVGDHAAVYPCAPLTLEEVKADIRSIGWEECPIGSILAVGSAAERDEPESAKASSSAIISRPISTATASSSAAAPRTRKKKQGLARRKKSKTVAVNALVCA